MRRIFLLLVVGVLFASPFFVSAEPINPLIGPLVPCHGAAGEGLIECQACHVVQLGQRIINFLVAIAAVIAVVIFSYAGWLMLTAAGDMTKISSARGMFWNVLIGLVIVLAGWLVIDTVMKWTFQKQTDTSTEEGSPLYEAMKDKFGPWNQILCVTPVTSAASTPPASPPGVVAPEQPSGPKGSQRCNPDNTACSPEALTALGLTEAQANTMSCIAFSESTGIPNGPDSPTGACGTFQIVRGNWNNPKLHDGKSCTTARSDCYNAECNMQTAVLLLRTNRRTPYSDWTCPGCNKWAPMCVAKYDSNPQII